MNQSLELALFFITILILIYILGASVFRKPISSTKITFSIFAILLVFWNFFEVSFRILEFNTFNFTLIQSVFSHITLYSLVIYTLHFPYFSRRENRLTYFVVFLGGIGYMVLVHTITIPMIEQKFPLDVKFYIKTSDFISKAYSILCLLCFFVIAFYKLINSIQRLQKILIHAIIALFLLLLVAIFTNYFFVGKYTLSSSGKDIILLDSFFIIVFSMVVLQFKFISFYPGILSFFIHGEIPRLLIQKMAPATGRGVAFLKNELWRIYELENISLYISDFWFSLIIDETLDNAFEHGGKRVDDEITIQVFDSKKFLDFYVIDMGKGFDPYSVPDPSKPDRKVVPTGRGIYILKKLFEIDWNFLGNEVRVRVSKNKPNNPEL